MLCIGDLNFSLLVVLVHNSWIIYNEFSVLILFFGNFSSMIHHIIHLTFIPATTIDDERIGNKHMKYEIFFFQSFVSHLS